VTYRNTFYWIPGILCLFLFSSCASKQHDRSICFQRKLLIAEHLLSETQEEVNQLRERLFEAKLQLIEVQIEDLEKKWKTNAEDLVSILQPNAAFLFLEEREALHQIIQESGPTILRAQSLLDRLLRLITQLSNGEQELEENNK